MTSSPERLSLPRAPSAVRVSPLAPEAFLAAEVERVRATAEARGREAGRREALDEFGALFEGLQAAASASGERAAAALAARTAQCVVAVAERILCRELDAGRYDIERMVRETLAAAAVGRAPCTVRVHPGDAERLAAVPFRAGTVIEPDAELSPGCVHVESAQGLVARDVDDVLRQVGAALEALEP